MMNNKEFKDLKKGIVIMASSASALALQGLFKVAVSSIKCMEKQELEGNSVRCYETDIAKLCAIFIIGILILGIIELPHLKK